VLEKLGSALLTGGFGLAGVSATVLAVDRTPDIAGNPFFIVGAVLAAIGFVVLLVAIIAGEVVRHQSAPRIIPGEDLNAPDINMDKFNEYRKMTALPPDPPAQGEE
jgi:hypothetical protein